LHDSLGQLLLVIKNRAFLGLSVAESDKDTSNNEHAVQERKQLAEILSSATEAISQTRHIAYALRPVNLERLGLTSALDEMIDNVADASGISFDVEIIVLQGILSLDAEINLFRIVQESINNIVKHSEASRAGVFITRDENAIEVRITDNGKGFDVPATANDKERRGGLGLTSIAERARILGGTYRFESTPETGTTIFLRLNIARTI
jgi:signal transduction histidine kinase